LLPFLSAALPGQETDLVDTRDLSGRGVVFVTDETSSSEIRHAASVGDVNGDGVSDIGLVHFLDDPVFEPTIYLIFGSSQWTGRNLIGSDLRDSLHLKLLDVATTGIGRSYIIHVGDLNEDGLAEFAFTSHDYEPLGRNGGIRGAFFIVHGQRTFASSSEVVEEIGAGISGTRIYTTDSAVTAGWEGSCTATDLNGDRRQDLVVGGLLHAGLNLSGLIHVLLETGDLGTQVDLQAIGKKLPGFTLATPGLPRDVADAGDFNGDGFHDLLVADCMQDSSVGSVYVFLGRADPGGHYDLQALGENRDGVVWFPAPPSRDRGTLLFGAKHQTAAAGDLDGDGFDDILMAEAYMSANLEVEVEGRVHIVYGGSPPFRRTVIHGLGGAFVRDRFGSAVSSPGDLNGDGIPELLVGGPRRSVRRAAAGEAYLIYGRRDFPAEVHLRDGFHGIRIPGDTTYGYLGEFAGPAGDFNGDGHRDFLVGEPGNGSSKAFVVFGSGSDRPLLSVVSVEPRTGFLRGGTRVRIRGSGFEPGVQVRFGTREVRVIDALATEIEVESPPGDAPGPVPVTVIAGEITRTGAVPFEYVADRPEIDLRNPGRWGLRVEGVPGSVIGAGLDFADLDGDGFDDLLIASNLLKDWVVTVVRGGRELPEVMMEPFTHDSADPAPGPGKTLIWKRPEVERTRFDITLRNAGDVNRDGITDVAVATRNESSYLLFGRRGLPGELDFEEEVEAGRAVRLLYDHADSFADFSPLGDVTGDGIDDLAIGLHSDVLLFVAGREAWPRDLDLHDESDPASIFSRLREGPSFAALLAPVGDVTGDGEPDLLVSGETAFSTVYLLHDLRSLVDLPQGANIRDYVQGGGGVLFDVQGRSIASANPFYVSALGDVNADGIGDFLIGHQELTVGTSHEGITFLVHGRRDFPAWISFPFDMSPLDLEGVVRVMGDGFQQSGRALGPAGDYNADGFPDFVLTAGDPQVWPPAHAFVVFGSPELPPALALGDLGRHGFGIDGIHRYTDMNESTHVPGDLNADGAPDFAFSESGLPFFTDPVSGEATRGSVHVVFGLPPRVPFVRGDANDDGSTNIADAVFTLGFLFLGASRPPCEDAADMDDSGILEITDAVFLLNHLFSGGEEPPPPREAAGEDPTQDRLGCRGF
jgi:hypothetical protein